MPKKRVTRKAKSTVDKENEVDFNQLSNQQQQIHCVNKVNKLGVNVKPEDLSTDEQNVFREMFDDIMEYRVFFKNVKKGTKMAKNDQN